MWLPRRWGQVLVFFLFIFFFHQPLASGQSEGLGGGIILDLLIQKMLNVCSVHGIVPGARGRELWAVGENRD